MKVNGSGGDTGLPLAIAAAWGLRQHPGKGPRRGLTVEQIIIAAVGVAQAEGLAAVSMNRVAATLGTTGMALYRYFSAKDELLDLMVDYAFDSPPPPPAPGTGWRDALHEWARYQFGVLRQHPWIVDVPTSGPPVTPNRVTLFEHGLRGLTGTALSAGEKVLVLQLVGSLTSSIAAMETQMASAAQRSRYGGLPADLPLLGKLVDEKRFPATYEVVHSGALDDDVVDTFGSDFEFGIERLLDGFEALMRKRAGEPVE